MTDYDYDIFISYPRVPVVRRWVEDYLYPVLVEEELAEAFPPERSPKVFVDWRIETGAVWPDELAAALASSRCLLAVWTPSYFRSPWCLAELETMLERERLIAHGAETAPSSLVCPLLFRDGELLPSEAQQRMCSDFKDWATPYPYFKSSKEYLAFAAAVGRLALELAALARKAPSWSPDWPILRPPVIPAPNATLPRLR